MTDPLFKIFVVDDDAIARMIAIDCLAETSYQIEEFDNGNACLAARDPAPDLILLDINMPGMDGIGVCRALRAAGNHQVQILFVSANDDLESRLETYDAGGNDFIVKPFAAQELQRKVKLAVQLKEERVAYSSQASVARQTAFSAMSTLGEMGGVLQFLRASFACRTVEELAQAMINVLQGYELNGLIEMRNGLGQERFSTSDKACTALELSVLGHACNMGRIFSFRNRVAVNFPHITLVVTNLPLDDAERVGRMRDHLALLVEGADAKMVSMIADSQCQSQAAEIVKTATVLSELLEEIENQQAKNQDAALKLTANYIDRMENAFFRLGLTEQQEAELLAMAHEVSDQLSALIDDSSQLSDRLNAVTVSLRQVAGNQC